MGELATHRRRSVRHQNDEPSPQFQLLPPLNLGSRRAADARSVAALAAAALLCVADRQAALTHAAGVPAACQSAALIFRVTVAALALAAAFTFSWGDLVRVLDVSRSVAPIQGLSFRTLRRR